MRILNYSLFSPYSMYCAEIWGNTYAANLKCLVLLQKRVVRLICGAQRLDHISSLFYDIRILKLPDMLKLKTAEIMYKEYNNSLPNNIHKTFVLYDPTYMTRQKCVFKLKYARTNLSTMCISINGVKLCNSLDSSVIHCKSVHLFKKNYTFEVLHSYVTDE